MITQNTSIKKKCIVLLLIVIATLSPEFIFAQSFGNGSDGNLTLSASLPVGTYINTYYEVSSISGASGSLTTIAPASLTGKKILIIQMDGLGAGIWETKRVTGVGNPSSNDITISAPVTNIFSGAVQIITIPEYNNFTINSGVILSCKDWDGHTGGVLTFNVKNSFVNNGVCDVSAKGYMPGFGGGSGVGGSGGMGGTGGALNNSGQNGGSTGIVAYSGVAGGGDGGMYGGMSNNTSINAISLNCPGCLLPAQNVSDLNSTPKKLLMGGAGKGGNGGLGKNGAGGGGGGGGCATHAGTNGMAGGSGADGGNGGDGGAGGGIIFFEAKSTTLGGTNPKFIVNGASATSATVGTTGGSGGNGGTGGCDCLSGGGGGGGNGADGGNGGNGGNGGAGGTLYYIYGTSPAPIIAANVSLSGGSGAAGSNGGFGGTAGVNGSTLSGNNNCTPPPVPSNPAHLQPTGQCNFMCCLNLLYAMRSTGSNAGTYTPPNPPSTYYSSYTDGTNTVNVEQISSHQVLITTGSCHIYIYDPSFVNSPFNSVDKIFTAGLNTFSYNSGTMTGTLTDGSLTFIGKCSSVREVPSGGNNGIPGLPGVNGTDGVFGGDPGQECDLNISINFGNDPCPGLGVRYTVTVTGGSGDYSASLPLNSIISVPPQIFTATATVTDNVTGCTVTASAEIDGTQNGMYIADISSQDISCYGRNDGRITILGGSHPLSISGPAPSNINQPYNSGLVTNLSPGTYTITDPAVSNGCPSSIRSGCNPCTVIISEPNPILITEEINPPACGKPNSGSATVVASGGTPPFTYSWNTTPPQTYATAIGLAANDYTVTVTDANMCSTIKQVHIDTAVCPSLCTATCQPVITIFPANGGSNITRTTNGIALQCDNYYFFSSEITCNPQDCSVWITNVSFFDANNITPVWANSFITNTPAGTGVLHIPGGTTGTYYIRYTWGNASGICGSVTYPVNITCPYDNRCCEGGQWTSRQISWDNTIFITGGLSANKNAAATKKIAEEARQTEEYNAAIKKYGAGIFNPLPLRGSKNVVCNMPDTVMEGSTRTFSGTYSCNPALQNCNSQVLVSITTISGDYISVVNQPSPVTQTFSLPGRYTVKYVAKCGGAVCDSCSFTLLVNKNCCAGILQTTQPTIRTKRTMGAGYITSILNWPPPGHYSTLGNAIVNPGFSCIQGCPTLYNWVRKRNGVVIASGNAVTAPISFAPPTTGEDLILIYPNCGGQQCTRVTGFYLGCILCLSTGGNSGQ